VIFPEGTRSKKGEIGQFKKGAFKLALDLGLPILPVTISGTGKIWPADTIDIKPGRSGLLIHRPIDITNYTEDSIRELMQHARNIIAQGSPHKL
jgi:1-acyl-sn-glycerol-3-phosphate acyltransferase